FSSIHYRDGLNLDHHLRPRQFFYADKRAGWIAAFFEKFLAQLSETRAVGHVGDKDRHGDDVIEFAAGSFESFAHAFERHAHLAIKIARIRLASFVLVT